MSDPDRELSSGLIRLHIPHHATEDSIYGQSMTGELHRHGNRIGSGTLYPILHGLEKKGYLTSKRVPSGRSWRKVYRITPRGRRAFMAARERVRELFGELFEK
jgi:DNA-binding PadR family transcriptional regulator